MKEGHARITIDMDDKRNVAVHITNFAAFNVNMLNRAQVLIRKEIQKERGKAYQAQRDKEIAAEQKLVDEKEAQDAKEAEIARRIGQEEADAKEEAEAGKAEAATKDAEAKGDGSKTNPDVSKATNGYVDTSEAVALSTKEPDDTESNEDN